MKLLIIYVFFGISFMQNWLSTENQLNCFVWDIRSGIRLLPPNQDLDKQNWIDGFNHQRKILLSACLTSCGFFFVF